MGLLWPLLHPSLGPDFRSPHRPHKYQKVLYWIDDLSQVHWERAQALLRDKERV